MTTNTAPHNFNKTLLISLANLIAGLLGAFAFQLDSVSALPMVLLIAAYAVLFLSLITSRSIMQTIAFSGIWAVAHYLSGLHWLKVVVADYQTFEQQVVATCVLVLIIFYYATYYIVASVAFYYARMRLPRVSVHVLLAVIFGTVFYSQEILFSGPVWLQAGHLGVFVENLAFLYPVVGSLGVTCLFFFVLSIFLYVLNSTISLAKSKLRLKDGINKASVGVLSIASVVLAGLTYYALENYAWVDSSVNNVDQSAVNIRVLHGDQNKQNKQSTYKTVKNIKQYQTLSALLPKPDIVVWPEGSVSKAIANSSIENFKRVQDQLTESLGILNDNNIQVYYGAYETSVGSNGLNLEHNVLKNSHQKTVYNKQHLVPFGEYTPKWFQKLTELLGIEFPQSIPASNALLKGDGQSNLDFSGLNMQASICFDILFSNTIRQLSTNKQLHLHATDLAWLDSQWVKRYMLNVARVRAAETATPIAYAANGGISAVIDAKGRVMNEQSANITAYVDGSFLAVKGDTMFSHLGNLIIYLMFLCFCFFVMAAYKIMSEFSWGWLQSTKNANKNKSADTDESEAEISLSFYDK